MTRPTYSAADLIGGGSACSRPRTLKRFTFREAIRSRSWRSEPGRRILRDGNVQEGDAVEHWATKVPGLPTTAIASGQALRLLAAWVGQALAFARHHDDGAQLALGRRRGRLRRILRTTRANPHRWARGPFRGIHLDAHENVPVSRGHRTAGTGYDVAARTRQSRAAHC